MLKLKDLSDRDRIESAKILKFEKLVAYEDDTYILAEVQGLLQKVMDVNTITKSDILVYKGKIRRAVDDLCQSHNRAVMEADKRKRKAEEAEAQCMTRPRLTKMPLAEVASMDEGESGPPVILLSSAPSVKLPAPDAIPRRKRCIISKVPPPPPARPTP